jgi:hypothetical protein
LHDRVLEVLNGEREGLYAILDAARDPLVLALLLEVEEEHQSLYEGPEGDKLAAAAPYLDALPAGSPLRQTLVREGWGKSWGIYLTCPLPFKEVRRHLRHFLLVETEAGKEVYFRFYDPRVLRVYLPTCNAGKLSHLFGEICTFLMESADGLELLRFSRKEQRPNERATTLETGSVRVALA